VGVFCGDGELRTGPANIEGAAANIEGRCLGAVTGRGGGFAGDGTGTGSGAGLGVVDRSLGAVTGRGGGFGGDGTGTGTNTGAGLGVVGTSLEGARLQAPAALVGLFTGGFSSGRGVTALLAVLGRWTSTLSKGDGVSATTAGARVVPRDSAPLGTDASSFGVTFPPASWLTPFKKKG